MKKGQYLRAVQGSCKGNGVGEGNAFKNDNRGVPGWFLQLSI